MVKYVGIVFNRHTTVCWWKKIVGTIDSQKQSYFKKLELFVSEL